MAVARLARPRVGLLGRYHGAQDLVIAEQKVAELGVPLDALLVHAPIMRLAQVEILETSQAELHGRKSLSVPGLSTTGF